MRPTFWRSLSIVFILPILIRVHLFLGRYLPDPIYRFGAVGSTSGATFPGNSTIDPNFGFIDEAVTSRAMHLLFSGHVPWWNSLEGFGAPLAGEMQSASFFILSPMVLLPNGNLLLGTVMVIIAGVGMLVLLRHLGLGAWPAIVGAIAYESCGTFSWLAGGCSNVIALLPWLIVGVELCRSEKPRTWGYGIIAIALSVALLICGGPIETAYLEGLVGVAWAAARLFRDSWRTRGTYVLRLASGLIVGLGLSAPLIVAFFDTLSKSWVGLHDGSAGSAALSATAAIQKFFPYIYGPIFASSRGDITLVWDTTGGFVGFVPMVVAVAGVFGNGNRAIRMACAIVVVLGLGGMFGGPLGQLLYLIPGVKYTAAYRYVDPAIAFAMSVLAAHALDDIASARATGMRIAFALVVMLAIVAGAYAAALPILAGPSGLDAGALDWHAFSLRVLIAGSLAICTAIAVGTVRLRAFILGFALCVEASVSVFIPTLSNPTQATVALGALDFVRSHIGLQRIYTYGPVQPNYGSYFGIASLSYNDIPFPARSVDYIKKHIDPSYSSLYFFGPVANFANHTANVSRSFDALERAGVKYVIANPGDPTLASPAQLRYRNFAMSVYELPHPTPYFSAPGCRIEAASREALTASCSGPSALCRQEVEFPGWSAEVDGRSVEPTQCSEIFQGVALPRGVSHIAFRFVPPHETEAMIAFAFAIMGIIGIVVGVRRVRDRPLGDVLA